MLFLFTAPQFLRHGRHRKDLPNPAFSGTIQTARGMKNAPRPCRRKTSARAGSVSDHRTYHTPPLITIETLCSKSSEKERIGYETLKSNHKKQRKFHRVLRIHRASATSSATQAKNQLFSYKNSEFFLLYVVRSKFYNFDFTGDCQILQTVFWLYHRKGAPFHKEHLSCWFSMPWVLISR